jgi:hypothetical protein
MGSNSVDRHTTVVQRIAAGPVNIAGHIIYHPVEEALFGGGHE